MTEPPKGVILNQHVVSIAIDGRIGRARDDRCTGLLPETRADPLTRARNPALS
jgi:hypothetical protein